MDEVAKDAICFAFFAVFLSQEAAITAPANTTPAGGNVSHGGKGSRGNQSHYAPRATKDQRGRGEK